MSNTKTAPVGRATPLGAGAETARQERQHPTPQRPGGQDDRVIAWLERSARASVRVAITVFKNRPGVDVRLHEVYASTNAMGPTARGIRLRPAELAPLIDALREAQMLLGDGDDGRAGG